MSGRSKNHTLKGGTSPYSLCMGVPPSPDLHTHTHTHTHLILATGLAIVYELEVLPMPLCLSCAPRDNFSDFFEIAMAVQRQYLVYEIMLVCLTA